MLKQLKDGSWRIASEKDLTEAIMVMREQQLELANAETEADEAYGLSDYRKEISALDSAIKEYLLDNDKNYEDEQAKFTIVKPKKWRWNPAKLAKIVGKGLYIQMCDLTPNENKIEELVRTGKVKQAAIKPAYEAEPTKAYVKITPKKDKSGDDEAARVAEAMNG